MSTKRKLNVLLSLLVGTVALHGAQLAFGRTIEAECLEGLESNPRLTNEHLSPLVLRCGCTKSTKGIDLVRANIGFVDADEVEAGDLESLRKLLLEIRELTGAYEQLDLKLVEIKPDKDGQRLVYRQLINGIPVDYRHRMVFGPDGHMSSLTSNIVDPGYVVSSASVLEAEAVAHAIEAVERKIGSRIEDPAVSDNPLYQTRLLYSLSAKNEVHELYWRISVEGHSMGHYYSYSAIVNANTGETVVSTNVED
jgi:hypothetical protein